MARLSWVENVINFLGAAAGLSSELLRLLSSSFGFRLGTYFYEQLELIPMFVLIVGVNIRLLRGTIVQKV